MILIDSSAWIEFLRNTDTPACREVDRLLARRIAVTDPISMEVLAGARDEAQWRSLQALLGRTTLLRCESSDYLIAAQLHRACRARGETVRKLIDCLIAAVAIRNNVALLHADADFDALARHTPLVVHPVP